MVSQVMPVNGCLLLGSGKLGNFFQMCIRDRVDEYYDKYEILLEGRDPEEFKKHVACLFLGILSLVTVVLCLSASCNADGRKAQKYVYRCV